MHLHGRRCIVNLGLVTGKKTARTTATELEDALSSIDGNGNQFFLSFSFTFCLYLLLFSLNEHWQIDVFRSFHFVNILLIYYERFAFNLSNMEKMLDGLMSVYFYISNNLKVYFFHE
jgi:hypothetical protein